MKEAYTMDQDWAKNKTEFDGLLSEIRASRARKQERHGDKFDGNLAIEYQARNLQQAPPAVLALIAAMALDRLAQMEDFNSIPEELAALDFDVDLDAPEGGEVDG